MQPIIEVVIVNSRKPIGINRRNFLIFPMIIISIVFAAGGFLFIRLLQDYYTRELQQDSLNHIRGYAQSLTTAELGNQVLDQLLEDRLIGSGQTIALHSDDFDTAHLQAMAESLRIDEINIYNPDGLLTHSSRAEMTGWNAPDGHPVHRLLQENQQSAVEPIRANMLTGESFKYGYFRGENQTVVQIGISAARIHLLMEKLDVTAMLNDLVRDEAVLQAGYLSNDYEVLFSTNPGQIGRIIDEAGVREAMTQGESFSTTPADSDRTIYRNYVPIVLEGAQIGILQTDHDRSHYQSFLRSVIWIGVISLLSVYTILIYTVQSAYRRNRRIAGMAFIDPLTGLHNIDYMKTQLDQELRRDRNRNDALLLINIHNFKLINMTHGYEFGDQVLCEVAGRLKNLIGSDRDHLLSRFSDDRFLLYIRDFGSQAELVALCRDICKLFLLPVQVDETSRHIHGHIGIVEVDRKYQDVDMLLRDALITISHSEPNTRCHYTFFNNQMEMLLLRESGIETELREIIEGIDADRLSLHYQPQIDLRTNQIYGLEALARLQSNVYGNVPPLEFIAIAEKKQLIVPLGNLILKKACRFSAMLQQHGLINIRMAVNISAIQLLHEHFTESIKEIVRDAGMNTAQLELEITESVLIDNYDLINQKMSELNGLNIEIALDDFGTGYSSFYRLRDLGVQALKIDKAFISRININDLDNMITSEIISMAHMIGLRVVAEGVEKQEQKSYLIDSDCDIGQGYLFSKPLPEQRMIELLKKCQKT